MSDNQFTSLEECEPFLDSLLSEGAAYADMKLYLERGSQVALRATSSDVQIFNRSIAVVRAIYGIAWGIHVVEKPSKSSAKASCASALKLARISDSTSILDKPIKLANVKTARHDMKHEYKVDPTSVETRSKDQPDKRFGSAG